jgi:outer membrane protein assembly factor BamB
MLMRLCFSFAGQQLYAVFGSIFLGMSDGKTFDLDSLNTLSRWIPSKVRDDAFYQSEGGEIIFTASSCCCCC